MSNDKAPERTSKYSVVPCKAPGRLYFVGEVGKMKFVEKANREGWYNRFDAATGKFHQIEGRFSDYTTKYDFSSSPSSSARSESKYVPSVHVSRDRAAKLKDGESSFRPIEEFGQGGPSSRSQSSERAGDMDLSSLVYKGDSPIRQQSTLDTVRAHTLLVELTDKKRSLNKRLQVVEAALEAERQKYLLDFSLSKNELMAAEKAPAKRHILRRKKNSLHAHSGKL